MAARQGIAWAERELFLDRCSIGELECSIKRGDDGYQVQLRIGLEANGSPPYMLSFTGAMHFPSNTLFFSASSELDNSSRQ